MVRRSVKGGDHNPYTLALLYNNKMWNLHIRRRYDQKYALGNAKDNEKVRNTHIRTHIEHAHNTNTPWATRRTTNR